MKEEKIKTQKIFENILAFIIKDIYSSTFHGGV